MEVRDQAQLPIPGADHEGPVVALLGDSPGQPADPFRVVVGVLDVRVVQDANGALLGAGLVAGVRVVGHV